VKTFCRISLFVFTALLTGCVGGGGNTSSAPLPSPQQTDYPENVPFAKVVLHAGQYVDVQLSGVPDGGYTLAMEIPASGDISLPFLSQPFHAAGITAADLGNQITDAYKTQKIYTMPVVTVTPHISWVNVYGDVRAPQRVSYTSDMTLLTAIIACGGFDEYADRRHVRITRGKNLTVIDAITVAANPGSDPSLYPGDMVYVPRTPF
jgi:protein involved in polysaccharide export with SLBB domain